MVHINLQALGSQENWQVCLCFDLSPIQCLLSNINCSGKEPKISGIKNYYELIYAHLFNYKNYYYEFF